MYTTAPGFIRRKVAGQDMLISTNPAVFNGYIALNETSAFLWDQMSEPRTAAQLAESMAAQYDVAYHQALEDVAALLQTLAARGLVQEVAV